MPCRAVPELPRAFDAREEGRFKGYDAEGVYLTSDEAGFDPNSLNEGFWQKLEPR